MVIVETLDGKVRSVKIVTDSGEEVMLPFLWHELSLRSDRHGAILDALLRVDRIVDLG